MKKNPSLTKKLIALLLSVFILLPYLPVVHAQEKTENQSIKNRVEKIFDEEDENKAIKGVTPGNIYIPADTTFEIKLMQEVTSKKNHEGDTVDFTVAENLIINGVIVIPAGEKVKAIVSYARKAGGMGRKGKLEIDIQSTTTLNNITVPLSNDIEGKGKTDGGAGAVFAAVSVVGGLFMKGTNVVLKEGSLFTVKVTENIDLNVTGDKLATSMDINKPRGHEIIVTVKS